MAPVLVHGDLPAWLVLGHRENLEVARTSTLYSRDSRRWRDMAEGNVPPEHPLTPLTAWQPLCVFADGTEHERLRRAVTDSLSRFEARGIRRYVTRFSHHLIDGFVSTGRADLVDQFAAQLPLRVVTQLFGMPEDYGPQLVDAARDMLGGTETAVASNDYITETLQQLVERKRATPGHDVASKLIEHPAGLSDEEVREHLRVVLVSANEPTVNLIANTLRVVLTDRRFRANLAGGHMTLPDALEQVLWDDPPMTTNLGRWATGDVELAGKRIREGDMLLLGLAAGNADPAIRPDTTAAVHGNRSHLAFSGGPHECPGQDLGRAIADTGIDILLSRLAEVRLAVPESELSLERLADVASAVRTAGGVHSRPTAHGQGGADDRAADSGRTSAASRSSGHAGICRRAGRVRVRRSDGPAHLPRPAAARPPVASARPSKDASAGGRDPAAAVS